MNMSDNAAKQRSPRNRTIALSESEQARHQKKLVKIDKPVSVAEILNKTLQQDVFDVLDHLPERFVDLVFVDPPYNLNKAFNLAAFKEMGPEKYEDVNFPICQLPKRQLPKCQLSQFFKGFHR